MIHEQQIWFCKLGSVDFKILLDGCDAPMRKAVIEAYTKLTGQEPKFVFSGWNGELDKVEQEIVDEEK